MTREKMKKEAINRMESLNIFPAAILEFKNEDKLNFSLDGILFWLDDEKKQLVKAFEEATGALVYHVVWGKYLLGGETVTMTSLLYVSSEENEWELERTDLAEGYPIAYVINEDFGVKEFGSIEIKSVFGGLMRVA